MLEQRLSGIVLPVASLPNDYGIGTFGQGAYRFVDFLKKAGQSYWQILPLSPTGYGDSPYQSCSARAGNPYFIDLETLSKDGLLEPHEYQQVNFNQNPDRIDYGAVYEQRFAVLKKAYQRGKVKYSAEMDAFTDENADWLPDYALFMAVKVHFGMVALSKWPDKGILNRNPHSMETYRNILSDEIRFHVFLQMMFFKQWTALKTYANDFGISIIGDVPIYVAEDSVEVWAEPELFELSEPGVPSLVAGVPPDFYSATGQLWGNPLYKWSVHEKDGFKWWIDRLRHNSKFFDVIRIDHFRGFHTFWEVKYGEETALNGAWREGPCMKIIDKIKAELPNVGFIGEDLGDLDEAVVEFIKGTGMPGMKVCLYGFDVNGDSTYMGHNVIPACVNYTSTHDSPTFVGWLYGEATPEEKDFAVKYLRLKPDEGIGWGVVKNVWSTPAKLAMAPLQDVLGLGMDARINTPSTLGGSNWCWRIRNEALNEHVASLLYDITKVYRRLMPIPEIEDVEVTTEKA